MLTSITPLGERGRGSRWGLTVTSYLLGSVLGGATVGALLGGAGSVPRRLGAAPADSTVLALAGAACVVAGLVDLRARTWPPRRQVNEDWLGRYRGWVTGLGFGYQLGLGAATVVTSTATYAVLLLAATTQSVTWGLVVGAAFGLARGLPAVGLRRVTTPDTLRRLALGVESRARTVARLVALALLAGGAALTVLAVAGGAS